ncbi:MAG: methyltransferase domain-containing protein [Gammaproteobacteria bacterium]|nr:methyltransferase domain-containing protein [Gammaproteobacteria bacterium]
MLASAMNETQTNVPHMPDVRRNFDRAAAGFDEVDFVHRHTGNGLLERLLPMQLEVRRVLELGSATGALSRQLAKRFRRSRIISLDLSLEMLRVARRRRSRFARITELQASAERIPLPTNSVDAVFANQLLPWLGDPVAMLREVARVLRPEGLFAFASLGPDSLVELREAFSLDGEAHVNAFADMHNVGDALVRSGLRDPVLDVDRLALTYRDTASLYRDLHRCGGNALAGRRRSLTGKGRFGRADKALQGQFGGGQLNLSLELVYGHAWGGNVASDGGEIRIDVADLRGRRRSP